MRAPPFIVRLVQWRWSPSVALVVGSLAFVGIVALIVPDDFDGVTAGADRMSRAAARGRVTKNADSVTETSPLPESEDEAAPPSAEHRLSALPKRNIAQSIFHPSQKTELPVEPVDPNPPPPPPEAPPPPPTNTIYTLPTPPPPAPPPEPGVLEPVEPQGITGDRK